MPRRSARPGVRLLALGGIRSGKSLWAETTLTALVESTGPPRPVRYLATGPASDGEASWSARVDAHRRRRPPHWNTVETRDVTTQLRADTATPTLVDDIGGWLTAAMDQHQAWTGGSIEALEAEVDELCAAVDGYTGPLALVSPEVGLAVVPATASGRLFADQLGTLNQRLAALSDRVVLIVAGQPLTVKESR